MQSNHATVKIQPFCRRLLLLTAAVVEGGPYEDLLIKRFFIENQYHLTSRPVENEADALVVYFGLSLQQIIGINERKEQLHANLWLRYEWIDYKLSWNISEYGGVTSIRLPPKNVWTPDILLYNSAVESIDSKFPTNVVVSYTGQVSWVPLGIYSFMCSIDIQWFPFDEQLCKMKFGSWSYDGYKIDLQSMADDIDMSTYLESGEWDVVETSAERSEKLYECCPEPYLDITFAIRIRRRSLFYYINLIIPCVMITILALFTFTLPPDSGEKIELGITVLLALTVFQSTVAGTVPATSLSTPLLGVYFQMLMIISTFSVITTVIVINLHHRNPELYEMPRWVRIVFCDWLAWILRIRRPGRDISLQAILHRQRLRQLEALTPPSTIQIDNDKDANNTFVVNEQDSSVDPPPVTAPNVGLTKTIDGLRSELLSILSEVNWITNKMKKDAEAGEAINDWKFVALVFDRLCLWVFTVYLIVGTLYVFLKAPNLYVR